MSRAKGISFVWQVMLEECKYSHQMDRTHVRSRNKIPSGNFTFHGSFLKRAVQKFERNFIWLKIEVENLSIISTVNLNFRFPARKFASGKSFDFRPLNNPATAIGFKCSLGRWGISILHLKIYFDWVCKFLTKSTFYRLLPVINIVCGSFIVGK